MQKRGEEGRKGAPRPKNCKRRERDRQLKVRAQDRCQTRRSGLVRDVHGQIRAVPRKRVSELDVSSWCRLVVLGLLGAHGAGGRVIAVESRSHCEAALPSCGPRVQCQIFFQGFRAQN